jgi:hypothetical protein
MMQIISLVACGWLSMYNPTDNPKLPITEWEQSAAADSATDCEDDITAQYKIAKKQKREFEHERYSCVPADAVYPHMKSKKINISSAGGKPRGVSEYF